MITVRSWMCVVFHNILNINKSVMAYMEILVVVMSAWLVAGQRPSFAGTKPIGFPDVVTPADPLGNRFGDDSPLPVEAKGDRALVERLSKLPIDKQPFWFINWKALEAAQKNPQTYPQKPNSFIDNFQGGTSQPQSTNFQSPPPNSQSNSGSTSNSGLTSKFGETNNGGNGNFASNGNVASTSDNHNPVKGYNRQQRGRGGYNWS